MKTVHHSVRLHLSIIGAIIAALLLTCINLDDNPVSSEYAGDYRLKVDFTRFSDTLQVLRGYTLEWEDAGVDSFYRVYATTGDEGVLLALPAAMRKPSPLPLYFTSTFTGDLVVSGERPNGKTVEQRGGVVVVNPYRIAVDSASLLSGSSVRFTVVNTREPGASDSALAVRWTRDGTSTSAQELPFGTPVSFSVKRPDTLGVSATLRDTAGNELVLDAAGVMVEAAVTPSVTIAERDLRASAGRPCTIVASMTDADTLVWHFTRAGRDTVTTAAHLTVTLPDSTDDTVIVTAKNRFGTSGTSDTVYLQVRTTAFDLELSAFPTTVNARTWAHWEVAAKRSGEVVPDSEVTYRWSVTPEVAPDSLRRDGGELLLYFNDNPGAVTVRVDAIVGPDTSWPRTVQVTVVADKPVLDIVAFDSAIGLGDTATIVIRTRDTNGDGQVAGRYYRHAGDSAALLDGDTLRIVGREAGVQTYELWCVDNDGFSSPVKTVQVLVTANGPYFLRSRVDTMVYTFDSVRITATARAGNTDGTITQWLWDFGADGSVEYTTTANYFDTVFTTPGTVVVRTGCRDDRGDSAETLAVHTVNVSSGAPAVTAVTVTPKAAFHGDTVRVRIVAADPNGTVDSLLFGADTSAARRIGLTSASKTIDTTILFVVATPGVYRFYAAAIDNGGLRSPWRVTTDSVKVTSGTPALTGLSPDTAWVFDTVAYTVSADDPDGRVVQYRLQWEEGGAWESATDSTIRHRYSSHGTKRVRVVVTDNRGNTSDTLTRSVEVKQGKPSVSAAAFPESVWINDETTYPLAGSDENGSVVTWAVQWTSGGAFATRTTNGAFTHAFTDTGAHTVRCYVVDDDGIAGDTVDVSVYVKLGAPRVSAVATNPPAHAIYIKDVITITVKGKDENDYIDSVLVSWNGDTLFETRVKAVADSAVVTHTFAKTESGARQIRFRVKDNDGLSRDSVRSMTVQTGAPRVDSVRITTVTGNNLFVNDNNTFRVYVSDVNGTPKKIYASWNGEGAPVESLSVTIGSSGYGEFTHQYDTTLYGNRTLVFRVADEDSVVSASSKDTTVLVRLGAPVLYAEGTTKDTIWVVIDSGVERNYPIRILHNDTNGTLVSYYWNGSGPTPGRATTTDTILRNFSAGDLIVPFPMWIYGRDDDDLTRGGRFVVFADSAPVKPLGLNKEQDSDSIQIQWDSAALDVKEGVATRVRIMIRYGNSGEPDEVLMDWRAAGTLPVGGTKRYYKFKKEYIGDIRYRVDLMDNRETVTKSDVAPATIN